MLIKLFCCNKMTSSFVLGRTFDPSSQDPIKVQNTTCDTLNQQSSPPGLKEVWNRCVNDPSKENKDQSISQCCNSVMLCNNVNEWLQKNNIEATCLPHKSPLQPHFGDVKHNNLHPIMYGIY
jgi:hypothetical protein